MPPSPEEREVRLLLLTLSMGKVASGLLRMMVYVYMSCVFMLLKVSSVSFLIAFLLVTGYFHSYPISICEEKKYLVIEDIT